MLLIILLGIGILFAANLYSSLQTNSAHGQYSSDESLTAHSSAWFSNMDTQFVSNLLAYDPMDGSERNANFWDPELDSFEESDGENPLFSAILEKDAETAEGLFEQVFSDAIMEEQITFAIAYDKRGLQLYCESSLYLVGVDPCAESAQPDYFLKFGSFASSLENGSVRRVTQISDLSGEQPVSINDTLAFPLMSTGDDLIAMVVVGRNVIDSLEQFSENFEIETAIAIGEKALTVHDYYEEERSPELNALIRAGLSHATETGTYSYSFIAEKEGTRVSSIPFSKEIRASDLRILIFDDQGELLATLKEAETAAFIIFAAVSLVILGLVFVMTTSSFNRILDAIHLLEKMGEGDLSVEMPTNAGLLSSKNDEVSRLQSTIDDYRHHRQEAEVQRQDRAKRRDERDQIMFEKMASLAEQLEGQDRDMLKEEISAMRDTVSSGSDEEKERASIEVMSKAFSRMSDEVGTLIDARTQILPGYTLVDGLPDKEQRISDFLSPGYLVAAAGLAPNPGKNNKIFVAPCTAKLTVLMDDTLSAAGAFGVDAGQHSRLELGGYIRWNLTASLMENITWTHQVDLFSNYLNKPGNVDVNWTGLLELKVNEALRTTISMHLIYDDDVVLEKEPARTEVSDQGVVTNIPAVMGPGTQFKEVLSIGVSYTL